MHGTSKSIPIYLNSLRHWINFQPTSNTFRAKYDALMPQKQRAINPFELFNFHRGKHQQTRHHIASVPFVCVCECVSENRTESHFRAFNGVAVKLMSWSLNNLRTPHSRGWNQPANKNEQQKKKTAQYPNMRK